MKRHCFYLSVLLLCGALPAVVLAQHDLRLDRQFFEKQVPEYAAWLQSNGLNAVFRTDSLDVQARRATLFLTTSTDDPDCETLQSAWETWSREFFHIHGSPLADKLLETWAFLLELSADSTEIVLHCPSSLAFRVRIFKNPKGSAIQTEEHSLRGSGSMDIPFGHLKSIHASGRLDSLGRQLTVRRVRLAIAEYVRNWYAGKGTPILYAVRMDTSESYYNEFAWEFSHLSNEVLEEGYFEHHRVCFKVKDRNGQLEIAWQFQGKFGSGILFPPRSNDYKLMETFYPAALAAYEDKLFKKIAEHLQNQP